MQQQSYQPYYAQNQPGQPIQQPYQQQYRTGMMAGREPEDIKLKPSWSLAWGLLWRWWCLILPFYGLIYLLATIFRQ